MSRDPQGPSWPPARPVGGTSYFGRVLSKGVPDGELPCCGYLAAQACTYGPLVDGWTLTRGCFTGYECPSGAFGFYDKPPATINDLMDVYGIDHPVFKEKTPVYKYGDGAAVMVPHPDYKARAQAFL